MYFSSLLKNEYRDKYITNSLENATEETFYGLHQYMFDNDLKPVKNYEKEHLYRYLYR